MSQTGQTPDAMIDALEEPAHSRMRALDQEISKVMHGHDRYLLDGTLWSGADLNLIAYGHYNYRNRSGKDVQWHIVGLSPRKNYISVYVNAVENDKYLPELYGPRLGKVRTGKSCVNIRKLEDVDLKVLMEMIGHARRLHESG